MKTFIRLKSSICRTFQLLRSTVASAFAGTRKRNAGVPWLVALAFTLTAQQSHACTLNVTGVNFGSYDVFSNAALNSTGNIDVNCPSGVRYSIALSEGGGSHTQRVMSSGAHRLNYNLYTEANRGVVWGDATSGTARVVGTGIGVSVNHAVYGRIPARQNVYAGGYSDIINVVLTF
jgi:spore coat protein U-like protein